MGKGLKASQLSNRMLKFSCADAPRAASLLANAGKGVLVSEKGVRYLCSASYKGVELNEEVSAYGEPVELFHLEERLRSVVELDGSLLRLFQVFGKGEVIVYPEGRGLGVALLRGSCFDDLFGVSEPLYCYPLRGGLSDMKLMRSEMPDFMLFESPFTQDSEPSVVVTFGGEWRVAKEGLVSAYDIERALAHG